MSATVHRLRGLAAEEETAMNLHLAQLEELHAQAMRDVQIMQDQGQEVTEQVAMLSNLANEIAILRGDVQTMPGGNLAEQQAWHQRADALQLKIQRYVGSTSTMRAGALEASQFRGLFWGLGVVVVAAGVGYVIWRGRKFRNRRG